MKLPIFVWTWISIWSTLLDWLIFWYDFENNVLDVTWNYDWVDNWTSDIAWKVDRARDFDWSNDYVNTTLTTAYSTYTYGCWIMKDANWVLYRLMWKDNWSLDRNYNILISSDNKVKAQHDDWTTYQLIAWTTITTTWVWYNCMVSFDWSDLKLYVDKVLEASSSVSWNASSTTTFTIWRINFSSAPWYANGIIDIPYFWNRALTDWWISVWQTATEEIAEFNNSWNWIQYPFT